MSIKRFDEADREGLTRILGFQDFRSLSEGATNQVDYYVQKFRDKMPATTEQGGAYWVDGIGGLSAAEKRAVFAGIKSLLTKERDKEMPEWLSESALMEDGFGEQDFVRLKKGDAYVYLFKLDFEEERKSIALQIGKYSTHAVISDPKSMYGVMSASEVSESQLEQWAIYPEKFEVTPKPVDVQGEQTGRFVRMASLCVQDYVSSLQTKVVRIYDEIPSSCTDESYSTEMEIKMREMGWDLQEMETGKLNVITKISVSIS